MFTCTPLFLPYSIAFCIASTCDFDAPCGIATSKALLVSQALKTFMHGHMYMHCMC